jgi:hypothetical protein
MALTADGYISEACSYSYITNAIKSFTVRYGVFSALTNQAYSEAVKLYTESEAAIKYGITRTLADGDSISATALMTADFGIPGLIHSYRVALVGSLTSMRMYVDAANVNDTLVTTQLNKAYADLIYHSSWNMTVVSAGSIKTAVAATNSLFSAFLRAYAVHKTMQSQFLNTNGTPKTGITTAFMQDVNNIFLMPATGITGELHKARIALKTALINLPLCFGFV